MQDQEKRKRTIAAATVAGVILIVILFAVVIYQIVDICVLKERRNKLQEQYNEVVAEMQEKEDWLEKYELDEDAVMYILALQSGYRPR